METGAQLEKGATGRWPGGDSRPASLPPLRLPPAPIGCSQQQALLQLVSHSLTCATRADARQPAQRSLPRVHIETFPTSHAHCLP